MRQYELRTYHLRTEEAAVAYLPHWVRHISSLKLFDVATHAFFSVSSAPRDVVAIISFAENADPKAVTQDYMQSDAFKGDMTGFDMSEIVSVDTLLLVPGTGSPLT